MSTEFKLVGYKDKKDWYVNQSEEEKERRRIEALRLVLEENEPKKKVARKAGTYPSSVRGWINKYNELGIEGLKRKKEKI